MNRLPDLPLKVPLEEARQPLSTRSQRLKQKNLERIEKVASNIQVQAKVEKQRYISRIRRREGHVESVCQLYQKEKAYDTYQAGANRLKETEVLRRRVESDQRKDNLGAAAYDSAMEQIKQELSRSRLSQQAQVKAV